MTRRGHFPFVLTIFLIAQPMFAQSQEDRVQQLEKKVDDLTQQLTELRAQIEQLKSSPAGAPVPPQDTTQDLTAVTEVQNAAPAAAAAKVFNPDTSVIGNFIGRAGQDNPFEHRPSMVLDEAEVAFEAFVDPYMKGKFFLSVTPDGIEVEEGYANLIALPHDLTAKIGRMKATFGKDNTWHTHTRPWVDQPLVIHNFFGDEGFASDGVSVSKAFPNDFAFVEATAEAYRDNQYNGHLKLFRDITENSNIELGTSFARAGDKFGGVDVTYRWKPLQQGLYRSFIGRFEGVVDDNDALDRRLKGFYASADYQLAKRWFTGLRLDRADRENVTDNGVSATLTFWPTEFSQFRGQLRRTSYGGAKSVTELLFGMQFSIGAHGAHTF